MAPIDQSASGASRSILVVIGGVMATLGLISGVLWATPQYHLALTLADQPVEMTWHELSRRELDEELYIRLTGVAVESDSVVDSVGPSLWNHSAVRSIAPRVDFESLLTKHLPTSKVYPRQSDPKNVPPQVMVPRTACATAAAAEQLEESGALTGRIMPSDQCYTPAQIVRSLLGRGARIERRLLATNNLSRFADINRSSGPGYVLFPQGAILQRGEAQQLFWLSGIAVAVGFVICGAGRASTLCCWLLPIPSLFSWLWGPLRERRAGNTLRWGYAIAGLGLAYWGYQVMVEQGGLGQSGGDVPRIAFGFAPTFLGVAAVLGAGVSLAFAKPPADRSDQVPQPPVQKEIPRYEVYRPVAEDLDRPEPYEDRRMVNNDKELPEDLEQVSQQLASVGFEPIQCLTEQTALESFPVTIQLGCQAMVVADVNLQYDEPQIRLSSALHDGFVVVTLSRGKTGKKRSHSGASGLYQYLPTSDAVQLMSAHLEQAAALAEKRGTQVVTLKADECVDMTLFARRVMADVQSEAGEENFEIQPAAYGRFCFPTCPIPVPAGV
ncbi:MAG: hypothetical protein MI861_03870 [Pirellulales bacterium]|nr:hypothetical protein [Pirellulales bacterium]